MFSSQAALEAWTSRAPLGTRNPGFNRGSCPPELGGEALPVTASREPLMPAAALPKPGTLRRSGCPGASGRGQAGLTALVPESDRPQPDSSSCPKVPTDQSSVRALGEAGTGSAYFFPLGGFLRRVIWPPNDTGAPCGLQVCGDQAPRTPLSCASLSGRQPETGLGGHMGRGLWAH